MALEYMAHVYTGDQNATASIRKYADDYLAPIDNTYRDVADLIWRAFRNGLVHGSWPQAIEAEAQSGIRIRVGVGNEPSDEHLAPIPGVDGPSFGVSAPHLLRDLKRSFRPRFRHWILHDSPDAVLERGGPGLLQISAADRDGNRQFELVKAWGRDPSANASLTEGSTLSPQQAACASNSPTKRHKSGHTKFARLQLLRQSALPANRRHHFLRRESVRFVAVSEQMAKARHHVLGGR